MPLVDGKFLPLELPQKHKDVLLDPGEWDYRCLYGGRNGAKDWSVAGVLIEMAVRVNIRVLCTREVMKTIKDSIHQLLADTIKRLGYQDYFNVTDKSIICPKTGASFVFTGLRDMNAKDVKSIEGMNICVIGEAESLTQKSFELLDPTMRASGAEVWIIYNPNKEDDFVYQITAVDPLPKMIVDHVNYLDLPEEWISDRILRQTERMKEKDPARYEHVWLGKPNISGNFFAEFSTQMEEEPFILDNHAYLYGSLDHGTTAPTSFGLWWKDHNKKPHRLFTYYESDRVTSDHAIGVATQIQSFKWCQGRPPHIVFCDPSMWTKTRHSNGYQPAAIDFYELAFKEIFANAGYRTKFVPANNDIRNGCDVMREYLKINHGVPNMFYWDKYNKPWVKEMTNISVDPKDPEKYDTNAPDHSVDDSRYGIVGMMGSSQQSVEKMDNKKYTKGRNALKNKYAQVMRDIS